MNGSLLIAKLTKQRQKNYTKTSTFLHNTMGDLKKINQGR